MKMQAEEVLRNLDNYLNLDTLELMFDNANYSMADARMTVFRSEEAWSVLFEEVTCHCHGYHLETRLYAYGNCLNQEGWLTNYDRFPLKWVNSKLAPVKSESDFILDSAHFSIELDGKLLELEPTQADYEAAGILINRGQTLRSSDAIPLICFLCHYMHHPFFAAAEHLHSVLKDNWSFSDSSPQEMEVFLQTTDWQHPHISEDERPSGTKGFQVLARAIETGDLTEWNQLDPSNFNTHWRYWDEKKKELFQ